jgi:hypothetical protein
MTPTEKAEKLVDSFEHDLIWCNTMFVSDAKKRCALIAVKNELESLMLLNLLCTFDNPMKPHFEQKITELKEIKTEIEKL